MLEAVELKNLAVEQAMGDGVVLYQGEVLSFFYLDRVARQVCINEGVLSFKDFLDLDLDFYIHEATIC